MRSTIGYSFSCRVNHSISSLLCVCIVLSTLISTSAFAIHIMPQPDYVSEISSHHHHGKVNKSSVDHDFGHTLRAGNTDHMQHEAPCDNCNHHGTSDCPNSCTANLCCTASGLSSFFNTLQINTPTFTERYLINFISRLLTQQPSLVLRPPIA